MANKRVWLQMKANQRYVSGFVWRDFQFGLLLCDDRKDAVSLVSDRENRGQLTVRLFQAVLRQPSTDSQAMPYSAALDAYEIVRQQCRLVQRAATAADLHAPNTTHMIDTTHYDIDAFGAECQIEEMANRIVDVDAPLPQRLFHVLGARWCASADTGRRYPAMTAQGPDGPLFWVLPEAFGDWVDQANAENGFPCDVCFDRDDEGYHVSWATPRKAEA